VPPRTSAEAGTAAQASSQESAVFMGPTLAKVARKRKPDPRSDALGLPEADVLEVLARQQEEIARLTARIPADRETYRYQDGKWSVREVFGHVDDTEQIFGYRALCISRGEQAALPGYEQDDYLRNSGDAKQPLAELARRFDALRTVNLSVLRALDGQAWTRQGTASGTPMTVRALAFVIAGHVRHHLGVLSSRYGIT
jgi:hypothetical protein